MNSQSLKDVGAKSDDAERDHMMSLIPDLEFDPFEMKRRYAEERDKRLRKDGKSQFVKVKGTLAKLQEDPWARAPTPRKPLKEHTEVVIVGGGFGGMLAGARLSQQGITDVRVIEIGADFGGTWYWNRYPGAMCDIEGHLYLPLLEELNYAPKTRYPFGQEILEHSRNIARHFGLYDKALLQTRVEEIRWNDTQKVWVIETDRGDSLTANYIMLACGGLTLPKLPGVPGINDFRGHMFHTARWDYDYTGGDSSGNLKGLADKTVGVIGTGATALQIVPPLGESSKQLFVFQRTPSSVGVRGNCPTGPDWVDRSKPGWQKERMENFTGIISGERPDIDYVKDGWTEFVMATTAPAESRVIEQQGREPTDAERAFLVEVSDHRKMEEIRQRVDEIVQDPETAAALKPWYRWACKRPGWHDEYLDTFNRESVHLVDTMGQGVERITPDGVIAGGREYKLDCLIFATGFEVKIPYTERTRFDVIGRNGLKLSEFWGEHIRTLHGTLTDGFPNCLFIGSSQQTAGTVNFTHVLDEQTEHAAYIIAEAKRRGAKTIEAAPEAVDEYVKHIRDAEDPEILTFALECTPGYYNGEGQAASNEDLFFGDKYETLAYFKLLKDWRSDGEMRGIVMG